MIDFSNGAKSPKYVLVTLWKGKCLWGKGNKDPNSKFRRFSKENNVQWELALVPPETAKEITKNGLIVFVNSYQGQFNF